MVIKESLCLALYAQSVRYVQHYSFDWKKNRRRWTVGAVLLSAVGSETRPEGKAWHPAGPIWLAPVRCSVNSVVRTEYGGE